MRTRSATFKGHSSHRSVGLVESARSYRPQRKLCDTSLPFYKKLDSYQQTGAQFALERKHAGLLFEQGTGKTWITGGVLEQLEDDGFTALLVVPLSNIETTWQKFLETQLPRFRVTRTLPEFLEARGREADRRIRASIILLLHYEAVPTIIKKLRKIRWGLVVYDEAHRLKDRASLASRRAAMLRDSADRRIILTGTPLEKQPKDLWAQMRFLTLEAFGDKWSDFEDEFLEPVMDFRELRKKYRPGSFRFQKALRQLFITRNKRKFLEEKLDDYLARIKPFCLRVESKDVLDLPPLNFVDCPVVMYGQQRKLHEEMEESGVTRINGEVVTSPLKITRIGKLHQICGGFLIDDEGVTHSFGGAKLRKTIRIVSSEKLPIVIFCRYLEEIWSLADAIVERHPKWVVATLAGRMKRKHETAIKEDFQEGRIDVLIAQIRKGGVGIDLFRSCVGILHSITYSQIDFEQAIKRLHRRGQEKPVNFFLVYVRGTIDEAHYEAIRSKRRITQKVLWQLIQRRKKKSWRSHTASAT